MAQLSAAEAKAAARSGESAALQPEIDRLRASVAAVRDSVFRDFCARMGCGSVEEWKRLHLTRAPEIERERKLFEKKLGLLVSAGGRRHPPATHTPYPYPPPTHPTSIHPSGGALLR